MKDCLIINGTRLTSLLVEDSTYPTLQSNIQRTFPSTRQRQNSTTRPQVKQIRYTPHTANNSLEVDGVVSSSTGTDHSVTVLFNKVAYEQSDSSTNVTFTTSSDTEQSITPIQLARTTIRVRCSCLDFRFRFATWNHSDNSLMGEKPPMYIRKTDTRPPANPLKTPGVCKHIIEIIRSVQQSGIVV